MEDLFEFLFTLGFDFLGGTIRWLCRRIFTSKSVEFWEVLNDNSQSFDTLIGALCVGGIIFTSYFLLELVRPLFVTST